MMTRDEYLAWCKQDALCCVDAGNLQGALTRLMADLAKHHETRGHASTVRLVSLPLWERGSLSTPEAMRRHIEGFS